MRVALFFIPFTLSTALAAELCMVSGELDRKGVADPIHQRIEAEGPEDCKAKVQGLCRGWAAKGVAPRRLKAYFRKNVAARESVDFELDSTCSLTIL